VLDRRQCLRSLFEPKYFLYVRFGLTGRDEAGNFPQVGIESFNLESAGLTSVQT
jgi:hypothetical protein